MKKQFYLILAISVFACNSKKEESQKETVMVESESKTSLQHALDEKKDASNLKSSDEKKATYAAGLKAVEESGIVAKAKQVGDMAPNFSLQNAIGKKVNLKDYLKKGPVVLVWYRGGWCPYCNITLSRLQEELPNFNAEGANLLALTPEMPDKSISTKEKNHLDFEVLSDVGNNVGREYGIIFKLTPEVAKIYNENFGLNANNGDNTNELPLAATYVIDKEGIIRYAFLDADYRKRAEPKAIIEALKSLK